MACNVPSSLAGLSHACELTPNHIFNTSPKIGGCQLYKLLIEDSVKDIMEFGCYMSFLVNNSSLILRLDSRG